ncbi:CAP domain-containing protein [Microbacterium rhizophilus]|uniref:CAP domain-containing protein n=1 Tax=Microbacterium rhizophilus TaxID=3138934 RepID=UPI0031EB262D
MTAAPLRKPTRIGAVLAVAFAVLASVLVPADDAQAATTADTFEAQIYAQVNKERKAGGLSALLPSAKLDSAAQGWAHTMARTGDFRHNPDTVGAAGGWAYGWMGIGENIAYGHADGAAVMVGWMDSPGHRANILRREFDRIGVGVAFRGATPYYVQVFGVSGTGESVKVAQLYGHATRPIAAGTPAISGTVAVGRTLTAKPGTWTSGATFRYQWLRDGKAISRATSPSYTPVAADAGRKLSVKVTGSRAGYVSASKTSAAKTVARGTLAGVTPTVSGTAKAGSTLTAKAGTWKPAPVTVRYQWLRDGKAIAGATASTYRLVKADARRKITVRVTGTKTGYTTASKTSAAKLIAG